MTDNIELLIIPDIHGRKFWQDALKYIEQGIPAIFLGDYSDPYSHEGITPDMALDNFKEIVDVAINHPNVKLLLGNHDLSYIDGMDVGSDRFCSRLSKDWKALYNQLFEAYKVGMLEEIENKGKQIVLSHAGLHPWWLKWVKNKYGFEPQHFNQLLYERDSNFVECLRVVETSRGGYGAAGSMVWADIHDYDTYKINQEDLPVLGGKIQFIGHSQQLEYGYNPKFWWHPGEPCIIWTNDIKVACLDCHTCFCIDNDNLCKLNDTNNIIQSLNS